MRSIILATAILSGALPALANDSTAELGTGGLLLVRTDAIALQKEELFISEAGIEVDYVFRNLTDKDVETLVAFPMPDIRASPYDMPMIPNDTSDDFLGFEVEVDGSALEPQLEQRAFAAELDVSADLEAHGVPLYPHKDETLAALAQLPDAVATDFLARGIIVLDEYDDGSGWKSVRSPYWTLKSTYWWTSRFPAGEDVEVSHRYQPSVGATVGVTFFTEGRLGGEGYEEYKRKYCIDPAFERAVLKAAKEGTDGYPALYENRISYVLASGGNWAFGTIGDFKLTIDKGDPANLVSFCGQGVRKIGPTTFEMTAMDFSPQRDIDVLILKPWEQQREADPARAAPAGRRQPPALPAP